MAVIKEDEGMLIHVIGSRYKMVNNIAKLLEIVDIIKREGHSLVDDWIDKSYKKEIDGDNLCSEDWPLLYKSCVESINRADIIIAEATQSSFCVGYQVALAVSMKKPILVLSKQGTDRSLFASGIDDVIEYKQYNDDNFKEIITNFIKDNDIGIKDMRFNFFIDRPIYNYLRWSAQKTGKTKAEILRELVQQEIKKK